MKNKVFARRTLDKFLRKDFRTVLDIGAGQCLHAALMKSSGRTVDICDFGTSVYYDRRNGIGPFNREFMGDFGEMQIDSRYDAVWCCHTLEHQLNPNAFLKKVGSLLKEGGWLAIVVPPLKHEIVGGHVSLWNAGLLLYHLVMAGFDCSRDVEVESYGYNVAVIVRKRSIEALPGDLCMDSGDIEKLSRYFPFDAAQGFDGRIPHLTR